MKRAALALLSGFVIVVLPSAPRTLASRFVPERHPAVGPEQSASAPTLGGATSYQYQPAVAWGESEYLVVWTDSRTFGQYDIYAARVSSTRHVLDPTGIPIATGSQSRSDPAVAFDGTNFLVTWAEGLPSNEIKAVRVDQSGTILDRPPIVVSTAPGSRFSPTVAWSGQSYLVTWYDSRVSYNGDIYGARVTSDGTVLDQDGLLLWNAPDPAGAAFPHVAWGGSNYLLVWMESPNNSSSNIFAERVDANGIVLDAQPLPITVGGDFKLWPSVTAGAGLFMVTFYDQSQILYPIRGTRVTSDGVILDRDAIAIGSSNTSLAAPAIGWDGTQFVVAWDSYSAGLGNRASAARVTTDGVVLDQVAIDIAGTGYNPTFAVAGDGTDSLVIWADDIYPEDNVRGCRVTQDGQALDANGFLVSTYPNPTITPAVASNGTAYLVVWEDDRLSPAIYASRVTAGGRPRDGAGIAIDTGTTDEDPSVAWDGTNYLIVWTHIGPAGHADVEGARLSPGGVVLDIPPIEISAATGDQTSPSVAWNGTNYLVTWADDRNGNADIYGTRVGADGQVLDPGGIAVSTATMAQVQPSVASDGSIYLVAWTDNRNGNSDVYGARIDANGNVLDPNGIAISQETAAQTAPALAWDGVDFLVAWGDTRQGAGSDIYAARVSTDGVVVDPDGIAVSVVSGNQQDPAVTTNAAGALVVWADFRSKTTWDVVAARVLTDGTVLDPHGASVATGDQDETLPSAASALSGGALIAYQRPAPEQPFHGVDRAFVRTFTS